MRIYTFTGYGCSYEHNTAAAVTEATQEATGKINAHLNECPGVYEVQSQTVISSVLISGVPCSEVFHIITLIDRELKAPTDHSVDADDEEFRRLKDAGMDALQAEQEQASDRYWRQQADEGYY